VKFCIAGMILVSTCIIAVAQPSREVIETCVKNASSTPRVTYTRTPANAVEITKDEDAKQTETTIRYGKDVIGTWEAASSPHFGLTYNGKQIPLNQAVPLSSEVASEFNPLLAMWGAIREGAKSYICITFNFEGLGQSGSFQSVRGIYLIDRTERNFHAYYTVGRLTATGVVLAK
jgi:hypothetical protein